MWSNPVLRFRFPYDRSLSKGIIISLISQKRFIKKSTKLPRITHRTLKYKSPLAKLSISSAVVGQYHGVNVVKSLYSLRQPWLHILLHYIKNSLLKT